MFNKDIIKMSLKLLEKYYFENHSNISFSDFIDKYLDDFMIAYTKLSEHFKDILVD